MSKIRLVKYRNTIELYMPWKPGGPERCKSVHGAKWDPKKKCWTYPLLWETCLDLRRKIADPFEMQFDMDPGMRDWAYAEKQRQAEIPDVLSLEAVDLVLESPALEAAVATRPFQSVGIKFGAMNKEVLLADDPGLGKTLQTIGMFQEAGITRGPILVVAPRAAAVITWPGQIKRWGTSDDRFHVFGAHIPARQRSDWLRSILKKNNRFGRDWILINPYWIRANVELDDYGKYKRDAYGSKVFNATMPELFEVTWAGVVVDESHTMLAGSTGNAKKWSQQRLGLGALDVVEGGLRIAISGTPFRGKPENLFGTLQWLRPDRYTSYWKWVERHFHVQEDDWGGAKKIGSLINEKQFYREAATVMIRRTKDQVAKDLPPKVYGGEPLDNSPNSAVGVWLPMDGPQKKQYDQMAKMAEVDIAGGNMQAIGILAEMTRLKQFSNSCMQVTTRTGTSLTPEWKYWKEEGERIAMNAYNTAVATEANATYYNRGDFDLLDYEDALKLAEEKIEKPKPPKQFYDWEEPVYRPIMPSNKVSWIEEFLTDRDLWGKGAKGTSKVIIASQFTGFINMLSEELNKNHVENYVLTGETNDKERVRIADEFQENPDSAKVFLLNTKAGGVSLTLDQADDVIICDETFIPDDQLQVEDRAHRLSNLNHSVTIWYLRSRGTIEESIGATTTQREATCKSVLDGARGVDFAKTLLTTS